MDGTGFYKDLLDNLSEGVYFVDRDRRIQYWNKGAEVLSGRPAAEVMGTRCADNVLIHTDEKGTQLCTDGCPLAATMADGLPRQASVYMLHKGGHRVPVKVKVMPLRDESGAITGGIETFSDDSLAAFLDVRVRELEKLALVDALTGAGNRRYAEMTLDTRLDELARYGWNFGVVMSDIDSFKAVNDTHGHDVGDQVLKMVARTVTGCIRDPASLFFRWGGEEFTVVASQVGPDQLYVVAERIRNAVMNSVLPRGKEGVRVTISSGATVAQRGDTVRSIMQRVDEQLYQAKRAGKNCTRIDADLRLPASEM